MQIYAQICLVFYMCLYMCDALCFSVHEAARRRNKLIIIIIIIFLPQTKDMPVLKIISRHFVLTLHISTIRFRGLCNDTCNFSHLNYDLLLLLFLARQHKPVSIKY